jgi:REP element-mobilizing transposase RayT
MAERKASHGRTALAGRDQPIEDVNCLLQRSKFMSSAKSSCDQSLCDVQSHMPKQLEMTGCAGHGGKRKGAGRPNKTGLAGHGARDRVNFKVPLHINTKLRTEFPNIRRKEVLKILQACCQRAQRLGLRVIHYSIQSNHLHLICEAQDNAALGRGMQALASSFAKALKKAMLNWKGCRPVKGAVFIERYHLTTIGSPTQMKRTLRYVLLNRTKHSGGDEFVDQYSSACTFSNWKKLIGPRMDPLLYAGICELTGVEPESLGLCEPKSWLASVGWTKAA